MQRARPTKGKTDRIVDMKNGSDNVGGWLLPLNFIVPQIYLQQRTIPPTTIIYPKDAIHYIHNIYYSEHDSAVILYVYDYMY